MIMLDNSHGVSIEEAARVAQVHRTTAARWRDSGRIPAAVRCLLNFHFHGTLPPAAGPAWAGWRFGYRDGLLYAPDLRRGFDARDLHQLHWFMQMDAWREAQARRFREVIEEPLRLDAPAGD